MYEKRTAAEDFLKLLEQRILIVKIDLLDGHKNGLNCNKIVI